MAANDTQLFQRRIRYQFESFCKKVITGERIDYLRWLLRRMEHETNFSALSSACLSELGTLEGCPGEEYIFDVCGYRVPLHNERLIGALLALHAEERNTLILYYSLGLKDWEIASLLHTSRSRIQRLRLKVLGKLQEELRR